MNATNTRWTREKGALITALAEVSAPVAGPPAQPGLWSFTRTVDPDMANSGADYGKFLESRKDAMFMYVPDTVFIVSDSSNYPSYPGLAKSAAVIMY